MPPPDTDNPTPGTATDPVIDLAGDPTGEDTPVERPGPADAPAGDAAPLPALSGTADPGRWLPLLAVWLSAAAISTVVNRLMNFALAGPLIITAAGLATYLIERSSERARNRAVEALQDRIARMGTVASPRFNAATRRGPVEPPVEPQPAPPEDPATPHDLAWLGARIDARREAVDAQLTWYMEARAALRAIIDGIDAPVFATDERGHIRLCNREGDRLFRRRTGRLAGLELEELFTQSALLDLHAQAQAGVAGREQIRIPIEGRPRVFEVSAVPVRTDIAHLPARAAQRAGVVLTLRDVTELAQAVQLKTDFVANASHELRTPMASIRAAVETMRGPAMADEKMRERLVKMIESGIVRLEEMVSDLLDLSSLESAENEPRTRSLDLDDLAQALESIFSGICAERRLSLIFDFSPRLRRLRTDPRLFQLILRNLIDNATKFAFEGTSIRIVGRVIGAEGAAPPSLRSQVRAADPSLPGVRLSVIDQGQGIPLKHQERIFERFYQVDESRTRTGTRRGTGLGLAIVKHAVRQLGGEVRVESVWQQGTTMTVTLPNCVEPADEQPGA